MKPIIRLSFLLIAVASFSGCSKVTIDLNIPSSLAGTWVLTDAAHKDAGGWYTVNTGVEKGIFYFYNNGKARYIENGNTLEGTWNVQTIVSGYYDENGNFYTDAHQSLSLHLSNYAGDDTIDMDFDNVKIGANSFVGTNYTKDYIGRYRFSRY